MWKCRRLFLERNTASTLHASKGEDKPEEVTLECQFSEKTKEM